MADEFHDRSYQIGREQFHAGIDAGLANLRDGLANIFRTMHDIQFAAPWASKTNDVGCA